MLVCRNIRQPCSWMESLRGSHASTHKHRLQQIIPCLIMAIASENHTGYKAFVMLFLKPRREE